MATAEIRPSVLRASEQGLAVGHGRRLLWTSLRLVPPNGVVVPDDSARCHWASEGKSGWAPESRLAASALGGEILPGLGTTREGSSGRSQTLERRVVESSVAGGSPSPKTSLSIVFFQLSKESPKPSLVRFPFGGFVR